MNVIDDLKHLIIDSGCVLYSANWHKKENKMEDKIPEGNKAYIEYAFRNGYNQAIEDMIEKLNGLQKNK